MQRLDVGENAFLIVHAGTVLVDGREAATGQVVRTEPTSDVLAVAAGSENARFTLFAGHPFNQPRAMSGPMVAEDDAKLAKYRREYDEGRFGSVVPFSHPH